MQLNYVFFCFCFCSCRLAKSLVLMTFGLLTRGVNPHMDVGMNIPTCR